MIKQRLKHFFAVLFGILGAVTFAGGIVYVYTYLPVPKHTDDDPVVSIQSIVYADDPAMLYQAVGIRQCERDALYKGEGVRAVLLSGDDLAQLTPWLNWRFGGNASAVLYTNTPQIETGADVNRSPALVALQETAGGYCILGISEEPFFSIVAGGWSPELALSLEKKYQPLLNQQQ